MCPYCAEHHDGECNPAKVLTAKTYPPIDWAGWTLVSTRKYVGTKQVGKKVIPFPRVTRIWRPV